MNQYINSEQSIEINFKCNKRDQKQLIHFILYFSKISIHDLAELIEENLQILTDTINGTAFLSKSAVINLTQLFNMFAYSCEFEF